MDQPTSWPWVETMTRLAPAARAARPSRPRGAAAPNQTVSMARSRMIRCMRARTSGVGRSMRVGMRTTSKARAASCAAAAPGPSGGVEARTVMSSAGRRRV